MEPGFSSIVTVQSVNAVASEVPMLILLLPSAISVSHCCDSP